MKKHIHLSVSAAVMAIVLISAGLSGCTSLYDKSKKDQDKITSDLEERLIGSRERFIEHDKPYGGLERISPTSANAAGDWLKSMRVTLEIKDSISAKELLRMLKSKGINITTATPIENHTYSGYGVRDVDGETALNLLLGSMGLDYTINNAGQFVTVTPIGSQTWYVNVGNRQTQYGGGISNSNNVMGSVGSSSAGTNGMGNSTLQSSVGGNGSMGGNSSTGAPGMMGGTGGGMGGGTSSSNGIGSQTGGNNGSGSNGSSITAQDRFWTSLSTEITTRLTVLVPNRNAMMSSMSDLMMTGRSATDPRNLPPVPGEQIPNLATSLPGGGAGLMTGVQNATPGSSTSQYYSQQVFGNFALNPETGAVTIRAPRWLLSGFDDYLKRIEDQYNTEVQFEGEIVNVSTTGDSLEGLDIAAFAKFAHGYGLVVTNNPLGGVTVTPPVAGTSPISAVAGAAAAGSALSSAMPMIGAINAANTLQVFNAYMSSVGHVHVVQRPMIITNSGVPGEFRKMDRQYYNNPQQTTASGVSGAAVGTQNVQVPIDTGVDMRIYPHYDVSQKLVRAQISLTELLQTGTQDSTQYLTTGTTVETIPTQIPLITEQKYSGEALLRDGDLIIIGGQVSENNSVTQSGITGFMDIPYLGVMLGRKETKKQYSTYYFALQVHVRKRTQA